MLLFTHIFIYLLYDTFFPGIHISFNLFMESAKKLLTLKLFIPLLLIVLHIFGTRSLLLFFIVLSKVIDLRTTAIANSCRSFSILEQYRAPTIAQAIVGKAITMWEVQYRIETIVQNRYKKWSKEVKSDNFIAELKDR